MPIRIQRKRTKGWKMPENVVYVGRPTKWGNPFRIGGRYKWGGLSKTGIDALMTYMEAYIPDARFTTLKTNKEVIEWYKEFINRRPDVIVQIKVELKGKNLACWCPLDKPCHADVLLEIANPQNSNAPIQ